MLRPALASLAKSEARDALGHPIGPIASLVGVALAVLALCAVHLLSESIRTALGAADATFDYTHVATRDGLFEADYFELRRRWRRGELDGVQALLPVVEGYVRLQGEAHRLLGFDPLASGVFGDGDLARLDGVAELGAMPNDADPTTAFLLRDVVMAGPEAAAAIAAAGGHAGGVAVETMEVDAKTLIADLPTAQRLLGRDGELDAIWIRTRSVRALALDWLDRALPGIAAALPRHAEIEIDGYRITAFDHRQPARRFADASIFNLGVLGLLALLMATFLAVQASRSNAARRRLEHQRLLVIGVTAAELRAVAVLEGLLTGLAGTALGLALGKFVAEALAEAAGAPTPSADSWLVGKAAVCGLLASTLAPIFVRRATAGASVSATMPVVGGWRRHALGALAVGGAALALGEGSLLAAFAALLLISVAHVAYAVPLAAALVGRSAGFARSLAARANLRSAALASGDIRLALGALSIASAVAIGMGLMVESLRRDFTAMLDTSLWEGVYATMTDATVVDADWLRALPGVRDARRYGEAAGWLDGAPAALRFADLDAVETARYGFAGPLTERALANEAAASQAGAGNGDTVSVRVGNERIAMSIAHVFTDYRSASPRLILPLAFAARFDAEAVRWRQLTIHTEPWATREVAAALGERHPHAEVLDHGEIRAFADVVFDRSFALSNSLAALALAVAVVGLFAALTALQANRLREFRLLSAIGFSRFEAWRLALTQTALLGATAAVAAVPLGLAIAWVLCAFVNPAAFGWSIDLRVDAASLLVPFALAIGGAVLAGALPTFRSAFRGSA